MTDAAPLDDAVMEACQHGSRPAFGRLSEARKDRVYSLAWYMTGDRAEAEDIAQQVFLKLFAALPSFRREAHIDSWLYQVDAVPCRRVDCPRTTTVLFGEGRFHCMLVSRTRDDRSAGAIMRYFVRAHASRPS